MLQVSLSNIGVIIMKISNGLMLIVILFSWLLVLVPRSQASDLSLLIGGWSYHYDRNESFNETHNLIGLCYKTFCAASYKNSYDVDSGLVYYQYDLSHGFNLKAGLMGGYSGHEDIAFSGLGLIPMLGLGYSFNLLSIDGNNLLFETLLTPRVMMFNLKLGL